MDTVVAVGVRLVSGLLGAIADTSAWSMPRQKLTAVADSLAHTLVVVGYLGDPSVDTFVPL